MGEFEGSRGSRRNVVWEFVRWLGDKERGSIEGLRVRGSWRGMKTAWRLLGG